MILDSLANASRYAELHRLYAQAFAYLRDTDLLALPLGKHVIAGDDLFAIRADEQGRGHDRARLESHRRYIDIQYVVSGQEEMGWLSRSDCREIDKPYDDGRDIEFYCDRPIAWCALPPGHFMILDPHDAHAPLSGSGPLQKVVLKVAV